MENTIFIHHYESPVGGLILGSFENKLCLCDWLRTSISRQRIDNRLKRVFNANFAEKQTGVILDTINQLDEYFGGKRTRFTIPLIFAGSPFQIEVWEALIEVPYGTTESYMGLASRIGKPRAVRAVASANGANAISIIVPCHRIIGNNGKLTGYAGGLTTKEQLLDIESTLPKLF